VFKPFASSKIPLSFFLCCFLCLFLRSLCPSTILYGVFFVLLPSPTQGPLFPMLSEGVLVVPLETVVFCFPHGPHRNVPSLSFYILSWVFPLFWKTCPPPRLWFSRRALVYLHCLFSSHRVLLRSSKQQPGF